MLALISVALVILVCSYRKRASQSSDSAEDMKQVMAKSIEINSEPEVLVIMAGDDKPTYLAKPITSSTTYCTCGVEPTPSSSSISDQTLTN
ncbi:protein GLUTAMINE DUMPER 6-like [Sesbania bispinosa]|nr:protein GLUTAMINE DUMPER 6-like [Sesbania bispinosa]